jgi:AraC-like DNA-binding protein
MIENTSKESDFSPLFSGEEKCLPSHIFGPHVRDYCIIHFCLSGEGRLFDKYGKHEVKAGELFIIREGEITTYQADAKTPWHYVWIATLGKKVAELNELPSVIGCNSELLERIKRAVDENESNPDLYTSFLFELLYHTAKREFKDDKISEAKRYIKYNYMMKINVDSISKIFGFERSYLYRLFKTRYGMSVKEYITKIRMEKAKELLKSGFTVKQTSELVGYSDEFSFSKAFKNYRGLSPLVYKMKE